VELPAALDSVLEVLYLMFNEGYSTHQGEELIRRDVCLEAIRLARLVADHPALDGPKSHALAALLLLQGARLAARIDAAGNPLLLAEQDRGLWDREMILHGLRHLELSARGDEMTDYHLEAGIAACHATAPSWEETDWEQILYLYDELLAKKPSPIVALNRAVAVAQVHGPEAGLDALAPVREHPALAAYYPLPAVEAELSERAGDPARAAAGYRRALDLPCPEPVRRRMQERLRRLEA
jgi:RNA polymerase sigma-70 factor (ECF subfamily)